jgi:hypothetical protein
MKIIINFRQFRHLFELLKKRLMVFPCRFLKELLNELPDPHPTRFGNVGTENLAHLVAAD